MNIITDKDQVFYFCKKEYNEKEKDNVPEDDIAYYGWSNNMNLYSRYDMLSVSISI